MITETFTIISDEEELLFDVLWAACGGNLCVDTHEPIKARETDQRETSLIIQ